MGEQVLMAAITTSERHPMSHATIVAMSVRVWPVVVMILLAAGSCRPM